MSTPLTDTDSAVDPSPTLDVSELLARNTKRANLLLVTVAFNVWVWGTRIFNFFTTEEDRSVAFIVVHLVLSVAALAVAGVVAAVALRMRAEARAAKA